MRWIAYATVLLGAGCTGPGTPVSPSPAHYQLTATDVWRLAPPGGGRFDASGLLWSHQGQLLTVSDRGLTLYVIEAVPGLSTAAVVPLKNGFPEPPEGMLVRGKPGRLDIEGIGQDARGSLYLCEESGRSVLRLDPHSRQAQRLEIDWAPVGRYFSATDRNASFEGVAVGDGELFVANERQHGRIVVVDLGSLKVIDDFVVRSSVRSLWGPQYSDLAWFGGELYVLMREDRVILRIDPRSHEVRAEYDFRDLELAPENEYRRDYSFTGVMEGLAVDGENFWLVTDNNGQGRKENSGDNRPTLFQCRRPDSR